jgi:choline dehydrogenase
MHKHLIGQRGPFAWDDSTIPQSAAAGRSIFWPHGRTLGGSSSINAMVYIRSNPLDYDTWRDAYGCHGWGYADLLPYFRRAEDQQRGESAYHGVGFYQLTQHEGRRWSTADGYLRPAMERNNLTVETDARVTRVLIEHGRAVGVRYLRQGTEREARARREVLLSGGAVNSPQLLMLSGVGPAEHLRDLGIEVVVDAPQVGEGLQDHPSFDLTILMCILLVIDCLHRTGSMETADPFRGYFTTRYPRCVTPGAWITRTISSSVGPMFR